MNYSPIVSWKDRDIKHNSSFAAGTFEEYPMFQVACAFVIAVCAALTVMVAKGVL